jgi:hypothetical protein
VLRAKNYLALQRSLLTLFRTHPHCTGYMCANNFFHSNSDLNKLFSWVVQGFFFSDYATKDGQPGDVLIGPSLPGEIVCIPMDGSMAWKIQKGSYLWCAPSLCSERNQNSGLVGPFLVPGSLSQSHSHHRVQNPNITIRNFCIAVPPLNARGRGAVAGSCDPSIEIGYTMQGCCNGLGSGEGFVLLEATGAGRLVRVHECHGLARVVLSALSPFSATRRRCSTRTARSFATTLRRASSE